VTYDEVAEKYGYASEAVFRTAEWRERSQLSVAANQHSPLGEQ